MLKQFLVKLALFLVRTFGLPLVLKQWPALKPILDELLDVLGKWEPSDELHAAASHYNQLVGVSPETKKS